MTEQAELALEIVERLDKIAALLRLAHADSLSRVRTSLRAEPAKAAILDIVGSEWTPTKTLQTRVAATSKVAGRTTREHIAELVDLGVLQKRGEARSTEYRRTGVI